MMFLKIENLFQNSGKYSYTYNIEVGKLLYYKYMKDEVLEAFYVQNYTAFYFKNWPFGRLKN